MENQILKLLARKTYVPANVPELLELLKLPANQQQQLQQVLKDLSQSGQVARIKGNRYFLAQEADLIPGRIQITRQGSGFLTPDDETISEIAIASSETGTAMHEDRVLVRRNVRPAAVAAGDDKPHTGTVIRVLERRRKQIVGTLKKSARFLYVVPDDPRMPQDIYVPEPRDVGRVANPGDKVVVELGEWESRHTNPEGEIIEVLGPPTAEGVDMLGVLRQYDLPLKFPRSVLNEVRAIGKSVTEKDCERRVDCRAHSVITIDPDDAKDFDDAIYLEPASGKRWKLWVHIADVSHYVKPGSELDKEARQRGNSTYLVDRVIPMLPEALSNELCSLKPNVDRLTKCVEFMIGEEGKVLSAKCYSAVIHSQRRYAYAQAFEVIENNAPANAIETMLLQANELAQRIRAQRFKAGSLELDFPETKIRLDDHGRVDRIERVENDVSHQLIEEFMLLANEAVAGQLMKQKRPSVYRIHEAPDEGRLNDYRLLVLSHHIPCGNLTKPEEVQKLLKRLSVLPIGQALKIGFLKSLMRARYSVTPLGHYGLAKQKYAHFTSPIRRYADLIVHRSLFDQKPGSLQDLKRTADHISATERNSADAERDSKDVKLQAYLTAQLESENPHRYPALITDLRNFGFFVDVVDLGMSGLVPLSILRDDFYELDTVRNEIRGRRTRRILRLGDTVQVEVAKVDSFKKRVDFRLVDQPGDGKSKRGKQGLAAKFRRRPSKLGAAPGKGQSRAKGSGKGQSPSPSQGEPVRPAILHAKPSGKSRGKRARRRTGRNGRPDRER
ncbi:MAG: ribonuclease R [Verrucomicrobia bacterium]|nr:ribonuclease R [Verrucomicrobiota bacterium]